MAAIMLDTDPMALVSDEFAAFLSGYNITATEVEPAYAGACAVLVDFHGDRTALERLIERFWLDRPELKARIEE